MEGQVDKKFLLREAADALINCTDSYEFIVLVKELFDEGSAIEVLDLFSNDKYKDVAEFVGWEIIGIIVPYLNEIPHDNVYLEILQKMIKSCSPKEVILALTERLDVISSIFCLQTCLTVLEKSILNAQNRRPKFFQRIFNDVSMLFTRLSKCTFAECSMEKHGSKSKSAVQDGKRVSWNSTQEFDLLDRNGQDIPQNETHLEDTLTDSVTDIKRIDNKHVELVNRRFCCMIQAGLAFIKSVILHLDINHAVIPNPPSTSDRDESITSMYICVLYTLLIYPLACYPLATSEDGKTNECCYCLQDGFTAAYHILETLFSLRIPFVVLLKDKHKCNQSDDVDNDYSLKLAGKAMLSYLILVKDIGSKYFPFVLSPQCIFQLTIQPIINLFKRTDAPEARRISVELTENIMNRFVENSITSEVVILCDAYNLFERFVEVLTNESREDLRIRCLHLFAFSIKRFEFSLRLRILRQLLLKTAHPGAVSFVIHCIKNEAVEVESKSLSPPERYPEDYFCESVSLSFDPVKKEDFNVLYNSDRIIAALNFLRYLLLRCSLNNDKFGILSKFSNIENAYIVPMQSKVNEAYSDHLSMLAETSKGSSNLSKDTTEDNKTTQVQEQSFVMEEINIKGIQLALNTLDIIRSLFGRISELYNSIISSQASA